MNKKTCHYLGGFKNKLYLCTEDTATIMDTKKFKQVPSINRIGKQNPNIPSPVVVSRGQKKHTHERINYPPHAHKFTPH